MPALKIPSTTTTNATGWIFGMHNIWCALKAQYPKHTMHVLPRLSHALPFLFVSKYELNQMEPYSKQRLDAEATRELLFRRLLMLKGEEDIEEGEEEMASSIHSSNTMTDTNKRKSDTRTQRDQWIGERDEKLNIEFRLRALWSSWNHVLSTKGGMGKSFLSGDAGPGMLDMVIFCTLAMMRPVARLGDSLSLSSSSSSPKRTSANTMLEGEAGLLRWFEFMCDRPSVQLLGIAPLEHDDTTLETLLESNVTDCCLAWVENEMKPHRMM